MYVSICAGGATQRAALYACTALVWPGVSTPKRNDGAWTLPLPQPLPGHLHTVLHAGLRKHTGAGAGAAAGAGIQDHGAFAADSSARRPLPQPTGHSATATCRKSHKPQQRGASTPWSPSPTPASTHARTARDHQC
jgi:hypothetical protein